MVAEFHNSNCHVEYENKILELMAHAAKQDEMLKTQAIQVHHLTEQLSTQIQQTNSVQQKTAEMQPLSCENASVDPKVTFTELTARLDKGIHSNQHAPDEVNRRQSTQSSVKTQAKSLRSLSKMPVSVRNIPSSRDSSSSSPSPKQSIMVTRPTSKSKHSAENPQEESSSDSSHQTVTIRNGATSMYGLVDQDKVRSPQGSKDSGLDSPKRFSTFPIRKINAFQGLSSIETTPITDGSEDRLDNVEEVTQSEDGEEKEAEAILDESTVDETETDTDSEPAVTSIHR